jgi:hypothetical protein
MNINERYNETESHHDFAAQDRFGRSIGARVRTFEIDSDGSDYAPWNYASHGLLAAGHYFGFWTHATRNGINYGACQHNQYFPTAEARDKAVIKYLRGAQTRADKLSGFANRAED